MADGVSIEPPCSSCPYSRTHPPRGLNLGAMRSFDPRRVGRLECRAWETYYRRKWLAFLRASIGLVRAAFGMSWPRTLYGAWLVLRANQVWAPYPDNDPDKARELMRRFYLLLSLSEGTSFDVRRASELEVEWWRVHREHQREEGERSELVDALTASPRTATPSRPATCGAPPSCAPRPWTSPTRGSSRAASRTIRSWRTSAPCSCARTPPYWPPCTARARPAASRTPSGAPAAR